MKVVYKGFEINAEREKSMGGDVLLYYSIFRIKDQKDCLASGRMMDNISRGEKPIVARSKKKAWRRNPNNLPSYSYFSDGRIGVHHPKDYVQTNPRKK